MCKHQDPKGGCTCGAVKAGVWTSTVLSARCSFFCCAGRATRSISQALQLDFCLVLLLRSTSGTLGGDGENHFSYTSGSGTGDGRDSSTSSSGTVRAGVAAPAGATAQWQPWLGHAGQLASDWGARGSSAQWSRPQWQVTEAWVLLFSLLLPPAVGTLATPLTTIL